jgi:hypothetical protein
MRRNQYRGLAAIAALVAVALLAMPALGVDPSGSPSAGASESSAPASIEPSAAASRDPSAAASEEPSAAASAAPSAGGGAPAPAPAASAGATEPDEDDQGDGHGKPDKATKHGAETPEQPVTLKGIVGRSSDEDGDFTLVVGLKVYRLSAGPRWWWGDASPLAAVVGKVVTIDGKPIRAPGRPPWAGGWKVVGSKHPGWAQWKVDKQAGKVHGRDTAPGQQNQPTPTP